MKEYLHKFNSLEELSDKKNGISDPNTAFNNDEHVSIIEAPKNYTTGKETIDYNPIVSSEKVKVLDDKTLSKIAWGIIIKTSESKEDWELVGNRQLWEDFKTGKDTGHPIGRYWLQDDGTARKCDPNDSTKFLDGSPVPNDKGQIMVYLPTLYFLNKTDEKTGHSTLWMSNKDLGGPVIKESMIGAFLSTNYDGKAYSRISDNIGRDWSMIKGYERLQAVGPYFNHMDYDQWRYIIMLHLSEFGTNNICSTIGRGQDSSLRNVGKTAKFGDKTCYVDTNELAEKENKDTNGFQNFLGLEGLIYHYVYCGGVLNHTDGVYLYKDPTKLYKTKNDITKLAKTKYRFIPKGSKINSGNEIDDIISDVCGGDYFDVFAKKTEFRKFSKWLDGQYTLGKFNDRVIRLFGMNDRHIYGLAYCDGSYSFEEGYLNAIRCGYFGKINFIN